MDTEKGKMIVRNTSVFTLSRGHGGWAPDKVLLMKGDTEAGEIPAEHQLITDGWNREIALPRLIYMKEKNRILLLVHRENRYRQYAPDGLLLFSDDRGATWKGPFPAPGSVTLSYLGNGKVMLGDQFSEDYGETWIRRPIPKASNGEEFYQWGSCLVNTDADGNAVRLMSPGYTGMAKGDPEGFPMGYCHSLFRFSYDCGLSWRDEIEPPCMNGGCGDPMLAVSEKAVCLAADGTIVAACRIKYKENVGKIDHYAGLGISLSKDNGYTWSRINVLFEYGHMHPSMVLMPDGAIVMTYAVRLGWLDAERRLLDDEGIPQWSVEAVVSRDNGATWDLCNRYVLAKWSGAYHVQDTSSILLPDGSVMTAFGAGYRIDARSVSGRDTVWMTRSQMSELLKENMTILVKEEYEEYVRVEIEGPETIRPGYDIPVNARGPIDTAVVRWRLK